MDLRQLECFLAVADELHFRRAAARLYMRQSTLSENIRALEHALGTPLFERTSRRVQLTHYGEMFRAEAGPAILRLKDAVHSVKELAAGRRRSMRIGFFGGGFYELYRPLVAALESVFPHTVVEFIELTYANHFSAVVDGTVDVAFCRLPLGADGLRHGPVIMRDQIVLCVPKGHRLEKERLVDPEWLAQEKTLRIPAQFVNQEWRDFYFPQRTPGGQPTGTGPIVRTLREALDAVSAGQGVLFLAKRAANYYASPQVSFVAIDYPSMSSALVWRAADDRQFIGRLNEVLVQIAREDGALPPLEKVPVDNWTVANHL